MQIIFDTPTEADVLHVAEHMRPADVAECNACGFYDMPEVLRNEIAISALCWAVRIDGEPACLLGVAPMAGLFGETGVPWLLGTELVTRHRRAFIRTSTAYIARMHSAFSHLLNFVHAENEHSVRWLKFAGFTIHPPVPFGVKGELFHCFEKRV